MLKKEETSEIKIKFKIKAIETKVKDVKMITNKKVMKMMIQEDKEILRKENI
jgi:hypothetical protein